jgi:hypothetical protein
VSRSSCAGGHTQTYNVHNVHLRPEYPLDPLPVRYCPPRSIQKSARGGILLRAFTAEPPKHHWMVSWPPWMVFGKWDLDAEKVHGHCLPPMRRGTRAPSGRARHSTRIWNLARYHALCPAATRTCVTLSIRLFKRTRSARCCAAFRATTGMLRGKINR